MSEASAEERIPERLMRISVKLFAEQGYAETSVQQIVDAAGVTKGAMYHYFTAKDDLLFDIYDRILTQQRAHLDEIVARGFDARETMRLACEDVLVTSIDWLQEGLVFFRSLHLLSEQRQADVKRRRRAYNDSFETLLSRGQRDGVFREDMPPIVLLSHFFADVHYLGQWYSAEGAQSKEQVAAELTELFLDGIAPRPATTPGKGES